MGRAVGGSRHSLPDAKGPMPWWTWALTAYGEKGPPGDHREVGEPDAVIGARRVVAAEDRRNHGEPAFILTGGGRATVE